MSRLERELKDLENIEKLKKAIEELKDLEKLDVVFSVFKKLGLELPSEFRKSKPKLWDTAFCPCGGIIFADTENCTVPVCIECAIEIAKAYNGE